MLNKFIKLFHSGYIIFQIAIDRGDQHRVTARNLAEIVCDIICMMPENYALAASIH